MSDSYSFLIEKKKNQQKERINDKDREKYSENRVSTIHTHWSEQWDFSLVKVLTFKSLIKICSIILYTVIFNKLCSKGYVLSSYVKIKAYHSVSGQ